MSLFSMRSEPLSLDEVLEAVSADELGGLSVFIGTVRNHSEGKAVTLLEYHAYESMAEKQMAKIAADIARELPGVRLSALHRIGELKVGDRAVICAAGAPHRGEAFRACRLLIDRIKQQVPVWKREHGPDGPYWVGWQDARCESAHENHEHHDHEQDDDAHHHHGDEPR